jgi:hypothetical protein
VLGVFYTPGWAAVFAVGGTLAGVVVTQGVNAWNRHIDANSKREDRQHERALEYEKRAWQAKSEALARLISACRFVKFRARLTGAENADENDRRAATIRALDLFKGRVGDEDGINEVYAYAAEPVCKALEEVLEQVDVQRRKHKDQLSRLRRVGTQLDALDAVMTRPVTDDSGALLAQPREPLQQYADLLHQRGQALDAIGNESDLDVDKVIALCDRVIEVAKKDQKGQYTE